MQSVRDRWTRNLQRSRWMLAAVLFPVGLTRFLGSAPFWESTEAALRLIYIVLGFSLIIFLHELGHFVVARLCSVKCLAFSIGIGPRMLGWRKGTKVSFGADPYDPAVEDSKKPAVRNPKGGAKVVETEQHHPAGHAVQSDLPTTAEEPVHSPAVGDCDYRVSWLPLGGYVRMLGQDDMDPTKVSEDPHAFNQRPIWQRMCIVSAGVIMNIIFAAVAFSIIFSVGIEFPPAILGGIEVGSPADKAGLKLGDRVIEIDGQKPTGFVEFTDLQIAAALGRRDSVVNLAYLRPGSETVQYTHVTPLEPPEGGLMRFGLSQMPSLRIVRTKSVLDEEVKKRGLPEKDGGYNDKEAQAQLAKLLPRDEMIAVDDQKIYDDAKTKHAGYKDLYDHLQAHGSATPVKLTVEAAGGGNRRELMLKPHLELRPGAKGYPTIAGLGPRLLAQQAVDGGAAAKAGIEDGDIIVRVGARQWPTIDQFKEIVSGHPDAPVDIEVLRDGQDKTFSVTPTAKNGKGLVGLLITDSLTDSAVAVREHVLDVKDVNALESMRIAAVDKTPVKSWNDIYDLLKRRKAGDQVTLAFAPAQSAAAATQSAVQASVPAIDSLPTTTLTISPELAEALDHQMHYVLDVPVENYMEAQQAQNMGQAVVMGAEHTKKFIQQVYMTLAGLFRGTVPPDNLHGIVGITKIGYDVQERGPIWLWYVLAMVSVNLAVANFLPLPIVDGGLFLLLILEKIRGRPLSLKVQSAIQVVGIVILGGLFLYVTVNDLRLFGKP